MSLAGVIVKQLKAKRQALADGLVDSPVDTMERYQNIVGQAQGLQDAIEIARKALDEDEQDDEKQM